MQAATAGPSAWTIDSYLAWDGDIRVTRLLSVNTAESLATWLADGAELAGSSVVVSQATIDRIRTDNPEHDGYVEKTQHGLVLWVAGDGYPLRATREVTTAELRVGDVVLPWLQPCCHGDVFSWHGTSFA